MKLFALVAAFVALVAKAQITEEPEFQTAIRELTYPKLFGQSNVDFLRNLGKKDNEIEQYLKKVDEFLNQLAQENETVRTFFESRLDLTDLASDKNKELLRKMVDPLEDEEFTNTLEHFYQAPVAERRFNIDDLVGWISHVVITNKNDHPNPFKITRNSFYQEAIKKSGYPQVFGQQNIKQQRGLGKSEIEIESYLTHINTSVERMTRRNPAVGVFFEKYFDLGNIMSAENEILLKKLIVPLKNKELNSTLKQFYEDYKNGSYINLDDLIGWIGNRINSEEIAIKKLRATRMSTAYRTKISKYFEQIPEEFRSNGRLDDVEFPQLFSANNMDMQAEWEGQAENEGKLLNALSGSHTLNEIVTQTYFTELFFAKFFDLSYLRSDVNKKNLMILVQHQNDEKSRESAAKMFRALFHPENTINFEYFLDSIGMLIKKTGHSETLIEQLEYVQQ